MKPVEEWNACAAKALHEAAEKIGIASPPQIVGEASIAFADLASEAKAAIERVTVGIERDRAVYIISLNDEADPAAFGAAFQQARDQMGKELRLPQFNKATVGTADRCVVYVGSSCATSESRKRTTAGRLRQHLIKAPTGTYALNLSLWASRLAGGITVQVYNYPEETDRAVVVAVEDQLSQDLSPICGRRGIAR